MTDINIDALKYETDFYTIDTSQYVGGYPYNGLTFINYGTSVVKIESITLQPNQQFEIGGNTGEITTQRFFVNFGSSTTGNNVVVVRKRYLNV
jgi:ATP-dependent Lon protease